MSSQVLTIQGWKLHSLEQHIPIFDHPHVLMMKKISMYLITNSIPVVIQCSHPEGVSDSFLPTYFPVSWLYRLYLYRYTGSVCPSSKIFTFSQFFLNKIWAIIYLLELIISSLNAFPTCPLRQRRFFFSPEQMVSTSLTAHYNLKVNIGWGSNKFSVQPLRHLSD